MTETKRKPRPRRARALLAIATGAAITGTVATTVIGCGDDSNIITNPVAPPLDMAVNVNAGDGNFFNHDIGGGHD